MMLGIALRRLARRRSRTLLAVAGIAISAALLLNMTMLAAGLTHSFGELMRAQGYGLRVTPAGTLPFDSEAGIRDAWRLEARIRATEGVGAVSPVLGAQFYAVDDGEPRERLFATGVRPGAQVLYLLVEGEDPGTGEVVVSRPLAEAYGLGMGDPLALAAELDVVLGQPREVRPFRVSGVGDFLFDYAGQRSLAMPLGDVQALTGRTDEVSLFAVAASEGVSERLVARRLTELGEDVSVYSTAELMAEMNARLLYFRQLSTILGSLALVVATLLVGTLLAIGVRERRGELATLRAIGVPRRRLLAGIVTEGVLLTSAGCLLGLPLALWLGARLDAILLGFPGIPARVSFFVFDASAAAGSLLTMLVAAALVAVAPAAGALRAPLGRTLREEAD